MSDFEVLVYKIKEPVIDHPNADRLSLVQIEGYICISAKLDDGSHRYKQGDLVVYIPEGAVMPEWMMKSMDFWDINKDKPAFRYVKAKKLRGIFSQGILYPTIEIITYPSSLKLKHNHVQKLIDNTIDGIVVNEGDNVAEFLNIIKYEPIVPISMQGQASGAYIEYTMKYDFDSIQKHQNMFYEGENVWVTEKLHGTLIEIGIIPGLNDELLFENNIFVTSKGVGAKGYIYKNVPENDDNLYIKIYKKYFSSEVIKKLKALVNVTGLSIHLFGEIFGSGVQDLTYGQNGPVLKLFDVAFDKQFIANEYFFGFIKELGLQTVPLLYQGPFDKKLIEGLRDGKDSISDSNVREGIVIKSDNLHPHLGRKIAKWVSPDYLLRKNGTEYV